MAKKARVLVNFEVGGESFSTIVVDYRDVLETMDWNLWLLESIGLDAVGEIEDLEEESEGV